MPDPTDSKEVDPKPLEPAKEKYKVGDSEVELDKTSVEQALDVGQKYASYINFLKTKGVIDDQGNIVIKEEPKEEPKKELTEEERLDAKIKEIEERQSKFEQRDQTDKIKDKIEKLLDICAKKNEVVRDDDELRLLVETQVLAEFYLNPSIDVTSAYSRSLKKLENWSTKKHTKYLADKTKKALDKPEGPGGSSPLAVDKPYTAKDLHSGAVKSALLERLTKIAGDVG